MFAITLAAATLQTIMPPSPCLERPLAECVAHLKTMMQVDDSEATSDLARMNRTDINGKKIDSGKTLSMTYKYQGDNFGIHLLSFELDALNKVKMVSIDLKSDPESAHTLDEYEKTGLETAFKAVLSDTCWNNSTQEIYKFFENVVKPKTVHDKKTTSVDETGAASDYWAHTPVISYCGTKFHYSKLVQWKTEDITIDNPHGFSRMMTVMFEK